MNKINSELVEKMKNNNLYQIYFALARPLSFDLSKKKGLRIFSFETYPNFESCGEISFDLELNQGGGVLNHESISLQKIADAFLLKMGDLDFKFKAEKDYYTISSANYSINFKMQDSKSLLATDIYKHSAMIALVNHSSPLLIIKAILWNFGLRFFAMKQAVDWRFVPVDWPNNKVQLLSLILGCYILRMYYFPYAFRDIS